jgi:hypothetical protein
VESRLDSFNDSIEQMLWPEKRSPSNIEYVTASGKTLPGWVEKTTETSYLTVDKSYLPDFVQFGVKLVSQLPPFLDLLHLQNFIDKDGGVSIGPIPKGTPVALLGNIDLDYRDNWFEQFQHKQKLKKVFAQLLFDLKALPKDASDEDARKVFGNLIDDLVAVNKCPDFIANRGHYFGTDYFKEEPGLSDNDKKALIAFLKTF